MTHLKASIPLCWDPQTCRGVLEPKLMCWVTSVMSDFVTSWTVAHKAPLSMGFSRQEYWSGLPFPSPGGSSRPRDQIRVSCVAGGFFTIWVTREALKSVYLKAKERILKGHKKGKGMMLTRWTGYTCKSPCPWSIFLVQSVLTDPLSLYGEHGKMAEE